jgi:DNA polymerase elongation subunit (family B)
MNKNLRIVLFDLETLPDFKEAMKVWPGLSAYPGLTLKASISSVICAGWKVFGQKRVECINAWDYPEWLKDVNDDRKVVEAISKILVGADVVVTHNGRSFDWKFLQTRLTRHGFPPLPKLVHIDTKNECKKNLLLFNNRLQTASRFLTSEEKLENGGWELWVKVSERDPKAMRKMVKYCRQDVVALEAVFARLIPFVKLPNANMFKEEMVCPTCASTDLQRRGERITVQKRFQRYQCKGCGAWASAKEGKPLKAD